MIPRRGAAAAAWALIAALAAVHHDFWFWDDPRVVLGFLPVGLAYHVAFSFAIAAAWGIVLRYAWPSRWEEWAAAADQETSA